MLTATQSYYLYHLAVAERRAHTVTGLAVTMNVSKAAVSTMMSQMERAGLLTRKGRELVLTQQGQAEAEALRSQYRAVLAWMKHGGLRSLDGLEDDAIRYLISMRPACVSATVEVSARQLVGDALAGLAGPVFRGKLPDGGYSVPFTVYRRDGRTVSMGDLGFRHPASLRVQDGHGVLGLRTKRIAYGGGTPKARGRLSELAVWDGAAFCPLRHPAAGDDWLLPVPENAARGESFSVRILVRASCGTARMPESEALIGFSLSEAVKNF